MQSKHRADLFGGAQFELAQPTPLFDQAKHFLDPPAGVDRTGVALVAAGAAINGRAAGTSGVLSYMGRDADAGISATKPLVS